MTLYPALLAFSVFLSAIGVAQTVNSLPAMWETWVLSLVWEDPLEKDMETYSSIFPCQAPLSMGSQELDMT